MSRIDVETGGLRTAGSSAQGVGADIRGLAGEIRAALAAVGGAAPPETASAGQAFAGAMETGALAVVFGIWLIADATAATLGPIFGVRCTRAHGSVNVTYGVLTNNAVPDAPNAPVFA